MCSKVTHHNQMCVCRQYLCIILRTRFPRRMLSILRWNIVTDHSKQSHKSFWHFSELWERANGNALKLNMFSCAFRTAPCAKWNRRWERKATFFAFHFNTNINCLVWFVSNIRFIPCKMTGRKSHCLFIYIYMKLNIDYFSFRSFHLCQLRSWTWSTGSEFSLSHCNSIFVYQHFLEFCIFIVWKWLAWFSTEIEN